MIRAFTDGSFCPATNAAGWGVVLVKDCGRRVRRTFRGGLIARSSSIAELYAVAMAIEIAGRRQHVLRIYTDCTYVSDGFRVAISNPREFSRSPLWTRIKDVVWRLEREGRTVDVLWKKRNSCRHSKKAHDLANDGMMLFEQESRQ